MLVAILDDITSLCFQFLDCVIPVLLRGGFLEGNNNCQISLDPNERE
jgi:hypothetical protein